MGRANKFGAFLVDDPDEYITLSQKYNMPIAEVVQLDMSRCGVYLPNSDLKENDRVKFRGQLMEGVEMLYVLPVRNSADTNFSAFNGGIYFKDALIGNLTSDIMLDNDNSAEHC